MSRSVSTTNGSDTVERFRATLTEFDAMVSKFDVELSSCESEMKRLGIKSNREKSATATTTTTTTTTTTKTSTRSIPPQLGPGATSVITGVSSRTPSAGPSPNNNSSNHSPHHSHNLQFSSKSTSGATTPAEGMTPLNFCTPPTFLDAMNPLMLPSQTYRAYDVLAESEQLFSGIPSAPVSSAASDAHEENNNNNNHDEDDDDVDVEAVMSPLEEGLTRKSSCIPLTRWEEAAQQAVARNVWRRAVDSKKGRVYYYHVKERITTWDLAKYLKEQELKKRS
eukprot:PhM_4_TR12815/c0_g1_i1/m.72753